MKDKAKVVLAIAIVLSFCNLVKAEIPEKIIYSKIANFQVFCSSVKSDIGQLIEFEPPLQVLEVKYERIRITKIVDTEDENGKYKKPIYENGNPVFATPEDEEYYEFLNFIGNSNSTLFVETDDPIGMITLTYKLYSEETINYYIQGVSINREADERRTAYRCKFSEHPLRFSPDGSIMIMDSNLNYNIYKSDFKTLKLTDSGCYNPDLMLVDDDDLYVSEMYHALLPYSYLSEFYYGRGYIELFEGKETSIVNGVEKETGHILRPDSEICTAYIRELVTMLECRMENVLNNDHIRIYKLNNLPNEDDFYRILEFSLGSDQARIITNSGEQEITLSFAPEYDQEGPRSGIIFPLFDFLDAMEITYHHPRANKGILISNFQEYGMYDLP